MLEVMQHFRFDGLIGAECEDQATLGACQPSCSKQHLAAYRGDPFEEPKRGALCGGLSASRKGDHLQLTIEIVGEEARHEIDLVPDQSAYRNIAQAALGLELREECLLGAPAVMEVENRSTLLPMVGHDDREVVSDLERFEEIQLDGFPGSAMRLGSNEEKAGLPGPFLGLPALLEAGDLIIDSVPPRRNRPCFGDRSELPLRSRPPGPHWPAMVSCP